MRLPRQTTVWGALGGMASKFGVGDNLGDVAALASGFDKLGLDADMITNLFPRFLSSLNNTPVHRSNRFSKDF